MCHAQKSVSELENFFTVTKMCTTWKNVLQLAKCVRLPLFKKCVRLRKVSHLEKCHSAKNASKVGKSVKHKNGHFRKIRDS